ncbi:MAG: hypothetical protein COW00_16280 [Bdellovibrio sp. CG12_big_fil_rev_8_21_14_0_65_39_13]|nr:MAG: hypothetical protein COW78_02660 [Bdellovibrio sp. CG22_combo_CG10-13_8_21_14_all_39_27]PIQ58399.1 MAG: hypothetical protein COW00_16280 [Bdellovibrio sp. CG12_big_fil_rev_8_21_14_0_65_39_13]PIR35912.1 MAG: hypothetical protein COV37_06865 [Bdellovibrio sp. CG11_big_fil_rev_8_21_14_0_20_39_38]PJB53578.1 MAG: hypothetical protein CO099_06355 [Bdellovibrio sp. CG_4_9_14_3_um_filter_39_7]
MEEKACQDKIFDLFILGGSSPQNEFATVATFDHQQPALVPPKAIKLRRYTLKSNLSMGFGPSRLTSANAPLHHGSSITRPSVIAKLFLLKASSSK